MKYLIMKNDIMLAIVFDIASATRLVNELRETSQSQIYWYKEVTL